MTAFFQFALSGFWTFVGTVILVVLLGWLAEALLGDLFNNVLAVLAWWRQTGPVRSNRDVEPRP